MKPVTSIRHPMQPDYQNTNPNHRTNSPHPITKLSWVLFEKLIHADIADLKHMPLTVSLTPNAYACAWLT